MSFPVQSTSVETPVIERVLRVLQRAKIEKSIAYAQVFSCRRISGSTSWSQHAYGNAADLFPKGVEYGVKRARCYEIANAVVLHATKRTAANLGRKIDVAEVIDHENHRMWTPQGGWRPYDGATGLHVHVSGAPLRTGIPECAR